MNPIPPASLYGRWVRRARMPAFLYDADQDGLAAAEWDPIIAPRTRRNWLMVGNRAIRLQGANDGTVAVFDETYGLRWLVAPDPAGSGISILEDGDQTWGTAYAQRAGDAAAAEDLRTDVVPGARRVRRADARADRPVSGRGGPVGARPRTAGARAPRRRAHRHARRAVGARAALPEPARRRPTSAASAPTLAVSYDVTGSAAGLVAVERFAAPSEPGPVGQAARFVIGPPATLVLERLGRTAGEARVSAHSASGARHRDAARAATRRAPRPLVPLRQRRTTPRSPIPRACSRPRSASSLPACRRAAAALAPPRRRARSHGTRRSSRAGWPSTGCIGGHTLDQASTYSYVIGFNGAARDPLQHALPLVYIEPDAGALGAAQHVRVGQAGRRPAVRARRRQAPHQPHLPAVRPRTCGRSGWRPSTPPRPATSPPSTQPLAYHPVVWHARRPAARAPAPPVPLLRRRRRPGRARARAHPERRLERRRHPGVRASTAQVMIAQGGSVLNSAMASWVLATFAGLAVASRRDGARSRGARPGGRAARAGRAGVERALVPPRLRARGRARRRRPIAGSRCSPGRSSAAPPTQTQARSLLDVIDRGHRAGSPLGARLRWPPTADAGRSRPLGRGDRRRHLVRDQHDARMGRRAPVAGARLGRVAPYDASPRTRRPTPTSGRARSPAPTPGTRPSRAARAARGPRRRPSPCRRFP